MPLPSAGALCRSSFAQERHFARAAESVTCPKPVRFRPHRQTRHAASTRHTDQPADTALSVSHLEGELVVVCGQTVLVSMMLFTKPRWRRRAPSGIHRPQIRLGAGRADPPPRQRPWCDRRPVAIPNGEGQINSDWPPKSSTEAPDSSWKAAIVPLLAERGPRQEW